MSWKRDTLFCYYTLVGTFKNGVDMVMRTLDPEYVEAFVKTCYAQGFTEEQTATMYYQSHVEDLMDNNPEYKEGFTEGLQKEASWLRALKHMPRAVWQSAKNLDGATKSISGTTALGAAGLGSDLLLSDHYAPGGTFDALAHRSQGVGAGGLLGGLLATAVPGIRKSPAGRIATILGGGAAGGLVRGAPETPMGPRSDGPYLPSYLIPGSAASSTDRKVGPISAFQPPGRAAYSTGTRPSTSGGGLQNALQSQLNQSRQELDSIDRQLAQLRQVRRGSGIGGSLDFANAADQIRNLESRRSELLQGSSSLFGRMRRDQANSLRSIADRRAELQAAIASQTAYAENLGNAIVDQATNNRWNPVNWPGNVWGWASNSRGRADNLNSRLRNLQAELARLDTLEPQVRGMVP